MNQNNLIPVFSDVLNQEEVSLVDARSLYDFLGVTTRFNDWFNRRVNDYGFIENIDFALVTQKRVSKGRGGDRSSKDYHLTLDMVKELSMVERTPKGREARRYFIECEKRLRRIYEDESSSYLFITDRQCQIIQGAVNHLKESTGESWQSIYSRIHQKFGVVSYQEILRQDFERVMDFLGCNIQAPQDSEKRESQAFALALMKLGVFKHFEVDRAYQHTREGLFKMADDMKNMSEEIRSIAEMMWEISTNSGAVFDGLAEAQMYLDFDKDLHDKARIKAESMRKPFSLEVK